MMATVEIISCIKKNNHSSNWFYLPLVWFHIISNRYAFWHFRGLLTTHIIASRFIHNHLSLNDIILLYSPYAFLSCIGMYCRTLCFSLFSIHVIFTIHVYLHNTNITSSRTHNLSILCWVLFLVPVGLLSQPSLQHPQLF